MNRAGASMFRPRQFVSVIVGRGVCEMGVLHEMHRVFEKLSNAGKNHSQECDHDPFPDEALHVESI